jgi:hypothetical protein
MKIKIAEIGITTFQTLLSALFDESEIVWKTVENEILEKFTVESLFTHFAESPSKAGLQLTIKSILEKNFRLKPKLLTFLKELNNWLSRRETIFLNEERGINSTTENELDDNLRKYLKTEKTKPTLVENDLLIDNNEEEN